MVVHEIELSAPDNLCYVKRTTLRLKREVRRTLRDVRGAEWEVVEVESTYFYEDLTVMSHHTETPR